MKADELNILLVDDDPGYLKYCRMVLQREKFHCTAVADPEKALELYLDVMEKPESQFDVVVSDLHMPGMSGMELMKYIKLYDNTSRVILISASGVVLEDEVVNSNLVYCFLEKTVDCTALITLLHQISVSIRQRSCYSYSTA